jgi:TonB family protein
MRPPKLFPEIPYTRQLGRLRQSDASGEPIPYGPDEVALLRASLLKRGKAAHCPRCGNALHVGGPVELQQGGGRVWKVRCEHCRIRLTVSPRAVASQRRMHLRDLVHSRPDTSPLKNRAPHAAVAVAIHAAVIVAAVTLTLPRPEGPSARRDTVAVYLAPPRDVQPELVTLAPALLERLANMEGFETVVAPVDVPLDLDIEESSTQFDPRAFSGVGEEGGSLMGAVGGVTEDEGRGADYVYAATAVLDEPPELISSPPLEYPDRLRDRGIEGRVVLQFVIDTLGRAERETIEIVEASHDGFVEPAKDIVRNSRYRPGRMRGRPVRVWSVVTINFSLGGARSGRPALPATEGRARN